MKEMGVRGWRKWGLGLGYGGEGLVDRDEELEDRGDGLWHWSEGLGDWGEELEDGGEGWEIKW